MSPIRINVQMINEDKILGFACLQIKVISHKKYTVKSMFLS